MMPHTDIPQPAGKILRIGRLTVNPPVVLAPMAGYTDSAFRVLCLENSCGAVYTEVANAESLVRLSKRTFHILEALPDERPAAAHIYGSDPGVLAESARLVEKLERFDFIDINCGCPVRKIVAKGCGAALIKKPDRIAEIVRQVAQAVSFPVTVKTRIGFAPENPNILEIAKAVEEAGASAIAIHGRFAVNGHSGPVDWPLIEKVSASINIPVIGNGGINSAQEAVRLLSSTSVSGIMIGRAAVGNPWLFREISARLNGTEYRPPDVKERKQTIFGHLDALIRLKQKEHSYRRRNRLPADMAAVLHFRSHLYRYLMHSPGWPLVRRNLQEVKTRDDIMRAVDTAFAP